MSVYIKLIIEFKLNGLYRSMNLSINIHIYGSG